MLLELKRILASECHYSADDVVYRMAVFSQCRISVKHMSHCHRLPVALMSNTGKTFRWNSKIMNHLNSKLEFPTNFHEFPMTLDDNQQTSRLSAYRKIISFSIFLNFYYKSFEESVFAFTNYLFWISTKVRLLQISSLNSVQRDSRIVFSPTLTLFSLSLPELQRL